MKTKQCYLYPWPNLLVKAGFSKSYKPRDVKFKKYLDLLGIKKGDKVLDVGCGEGIFLARLAKTYGADCTGIDISKQSIAAAKQWQSPRLRFHVADATQLPFPDESFNHVLSFDVLEHIRDQSKALFEMVRVLKPGGLLLIYTINKSQRYTWNFWLGKLGIDIYERVAHDPDLFLHPSWVRKELEEIGIEVERLELFNSFFTLAADEAIMVLLLGLRPFNFFDPPSHKASTFAEASADKSGGQAPSSRFKVAAGRVFLNLADFLSRLSLAPSEVLEIPWKRCGYSNSFFVLGSKR